MLGTFGFTRMRAVRRLQDKTLHDLPIIGRSRNFDLEPGTTKQARIKVNSKMKIHALSFQFNFPVWFMLALNNDGEPMYEGTKVYEGKNFDISITLDANYAYISLISHDDDVEAPEEWKSVIVLTGTASEDDVVILDVEIIDL